MESAARSAHMFGELLAATADRLDVSRDRALALWDPGLDPRAVREVPARDTASVARDPDELICRYEALLAENPGERAASGAWFTPSSVVSRVLDLAGVAPGERVCDPACGAGAFLLGAARRGARVTGMDLDAAAVATARGVLWWESGAPWSQFGAADVGVGDALLHPWARKFDAVVGNPPFLGQLSRATAHSRARAAALAERWGTTTYADAAALFQLLAADLVDEGGRTALLAPASWLSARDAGPLRRRLAAELDPVAFWLATDRVFADAAVHPALVVLRRGPVAEAARYLDRDFRRVSDVAVDRGAWRAADRWTPWLADALGIPPVTFGAGRRLAELAEVVADFRDQYYGLVAAVREHAPGLSPLVTVGAIDLGRCTWGSTPVRFARRAWHKPAVDTAVLSPAMTAWAAERLRPKLLLATQTRVIEVVADAPGAWLPSVPVISVIPADPAQIWHLGAALASPPATAWAAMRSLGAGLTPGVIKLAAREVRDLPLPPPGPAWDAAADAFRALGDPGADPARFARLATEAYGLRPELFVPWWLARQRARRSR